MINDIPVLEPREGDGPARRVAAALGRLHPAAVWFIGLLLGIVVLTVVTILWGVLLVHVLLPAGLEGPDERAVRELTELRSARVNHLTNIGSLVGDAPVLPAVVLLVSLVALVLKRFQVAAFMVAAGAAELAVYRIATLTVSRERPDVTRLDPQLPMDQSFPSGHTGASVAVYAGLVLVLASRWPRLRVLWVLAVALPAVVMLSRMMRGMHHPTDVASGTLVGIGCIAIALMATRAAVVVSRRRARDRGDDAAAAPVTDAPAQDSC